VNEAPKRLCVARRRRCIKCRLVSGYDPKISRPRVMLGSPPVTPTYGLPRYALLMYEALVFRRSGLFSLVILIRNRSASFTAPASLLLHPNLVGPRTRRNPSGLAQIFLRSDPLNHTPAEAHRPFLYSPSSYSFYSADVSSIALITQTVSPLSAYDTINKRPRDDSPTIR